MEEMDSGEKRLNELGYKQELRREMITLLNEDGAILSSKYLKSVACLDTGKNFEFPKYLVEICERRASAAGQEGDSNARSLCKDLHMKGFINQIPPKPDKCDKLVTPRKDCKIPLCSVPKKESSGLRISNAKASAATSSLPKDHSKKVTNYCKSKIDSFGNSSTATLRDAAWQILSVLKKPSPGGSFVVEQGFTSQSSDRCQLDLQMSYEKTETSACHGLKSSNSQKSSISAAHIVLDADCEEFSSGNDRASSIWSSGALALDTSPTKCISNNAGGHSGVTKISEVLSDPMLTGSSQTNKPDKPISDIGFSREVIHNIKPIAPSQNSLGALNGKHDISASTSSLLKDNLDANERSSLHGVDTCISSDSTPDQLSAKASQTGERYESVSFVIAASSVHATSEATKDPVILSSVELDNAEDFPTFYLGL